MATAKKSKPKKPESSVGSSAAKKGSKPKRRESSERSAKATKPAKRAAPTTPNVDAPIDVAPPAKERKEYDALLREISLAERDELRGWDRKWEAVATVLSKKYFLFDDETPNAAAWMKKHTREEYRTGARNARVAKLASPDEEQKFTVTKIDLAYSIDEARRRAEAKAKGVEWRAPEVPTKLDLEALRYTVERDGKRRSLTLEQVTAEELRKLQGKQSRADGAPAARIPKSAKALTKAIAADAALNDVTVKVSDNKVTLDDVRFDQLAALGRVLVALKLDEE